MLTLRKALKLCQLSKDDVIYLRNNKIRIRINLASMSVQEAKEKYNVRTTIVTAINPHFQHGQFDGFIFSIKKGA